jgi:hypothetical protein
MNLRQALSGHRLVDALASLRVAVVCMVVLAAACAVATFYESAHGTAAAQRAFYRTRWFTLVLALLAANVLFSMLKRFPWSRHQAGFVFAHVGILLILGGSLVSLYAGLDGNVALYEGQTTDRIALAERALDVALDGGTPTAFDVDFESHPPRPGRPQRFALPDGPTLVVEKVAPHVEVRETLEPGESGPMALHFVLSGSFGQQDGWLMAGDPERARAEFGPLTLSLESAGAEEASGSPTSAAANRVAFVAGPGTQVRYTLVSAKAGRRRGTVEVGRPIETPWMGMTLTVERILDHAVTRRAVDPAPSPAKESRRQPAVRIWLEKGATVTSPLWVPWGERVSLPWSGGKAQVAYRERETTMPFRATLLQFRSEKYPGSAMPATYESRVRIDDPEGGISEHLISMNHPLHYRGYIFFQASFVEGEPMMSILSVSRSPGLPLVYAGTALVSLGVAWMFYLKPILARRQAARALVARKDRARPSDLSGASVAPVRG